MSSNQVGQSVLSAHEMFFRTLEAGEIELRQIIDHGLTIFGFTRIGKTTLAHLLSHGALTAIGNSLDSLSWKPGLKNQVLNAKEVSDSKESVTLIPNLFDMTSQKYQGVKILDEPGYGDSDGFYKIFLNGYFHYRTFSRCLKMTFILTFEWDNLKGIDGYFVTTLKTFCNSFNNYQRIKKQIINACVFVVTKVKADCKIETVIEMLNNHFIKDKKIDQNYKEIINQIIVQTKNKNERLYLFFKPQERDENYIKSTQNQPKMAQRILQNTKPWCRPRSTIHDNEVDMSDITIGVANQILYNLNSHNPELEQFKISFYEFVRQAGQRLRTYLTDPDTGFIRVLLSLQEDLKRLPINDNPKLEFEKIMELFVDKHYQKLDSDKKRKDARRQIEKDNLKMPHGKKLIKNELPQQKKAQVESQQYINVYWEVGHFIKNSCTEMIKTLIELKDRDLSLIDIIMQHFRKLYAKLNGIRHRGEQQDSKFEHYCYLIHHILEQNALFLNLLYCNEHVKTELANKTSAKLDVLRLLADEFYPQIMNQFKLDQALTELVKNYQGSDQKQINWQIVTALQKKLGQSQQPEVEVETLLKVLLLDLPSNERSQLDKSLKKLGKYRKRMMEMGSKYKEDIMFLLFRVTKKLGQILLSCQRFEEAIEVYQSINNAYQVLHCYECWIKLLLRGDNSRRVLLIKYGNYASSVCRNELAISCFQKAYDICQNIEQLKEVSTLIIEQGTKSIYSYQKYLKRMASEQVVNLIPKITQQKLEK